MALYHREDEDAGLPAPWPVARPSHERAFMNTIQTIRRCQADTCDQGRKACTEPICYPTPPAALDSEQGAAGDDMPGRVVPPEERADRVALALAAIAFVAVAIGGITAILHKAADPSAVVAPASAPKVRT